MTYFKKLSQHLCDLSEEKYLKSQSAQPVFGRNSYTGTPEYKTRILTTLLLCSVHLSGGIQELRPKHFSKNNCYYVGIRSGVHMDTLSMCQHDGETRIREKNSTENINRTYIHIRNSEKLSCGCCWNVSSNGNKKAPPPPRPSIYTTALHVFLSLVSTLQSFL